MLFLSMNVDVYVSVSVAEITVRLKRIKHIFEGQLQHGR